jgi:aspartate carbamoyltransferase
MNRFSVLGVLQFTKKEVLQYIKSAERIKRHGPSMFYPDKTLITLFYEPSTRTSCSFQHAAYELGCKVISITDKVSSVAKGESLEDTIKTVNYYGDAIVLRHPEKGSSKRADKVSKIPILNAGDGDGEHPSQALLDIYTIHTELLKHGIELDNETREPIVVTFMGDLKHSRTIHSLVHMLTLFPKVSFIYVHSPSLDMPEEIKKKVSELGFQQTIMSLEDAITKTDVLYVTRIQKERFATVEEYDTANRHKNCIDTYRMTLAKCSMILMHPLPRLDEISVEVDSDPRAVYFKQVENGVYMRMAMLETIFK